MHLKIAHNMILKMNTKNILEKDMWTEQILVTFGQKQMEGRLFLDCLGQSVKIERTEEIT